LNLVQTALGLHDAAFAIAIYFLTE